MTQTWKGWFLIPEILFDFRSNFTWEIFIHTKKNEKRCKVPPCLLILRSLRATWWWLRPARAAGSSQFQKYIIYSSEVTSGSHGAERSEEECVPFWPAFQSWVPTNKQKEHLEFIKCLKYNKNAYIYQKTLKKIPPSSKTSIWKRNQGQCEFLAVFLGLDIKFFLDRRAEFLYSSVRWSFLRGNCSQLEIIF